MLTLQDLIRPITPDQLRQVIYRQLERLGIETTNWKPGAVVRTIFAVVCSVFASFSSWSSASVSSMFLTRARGDWLTAKAHYDYSTERIIEQPASGNVQIVNSGAGVYLFDPDDLTLKADKTQVDGSTVSFFYHNKEAVSIASGSPTPTTYSVPFECEVPGTAGGLLPGDTVTLQPEYSGLVASIVTALNGSDDESDQSLINRAQLAADAVSPNGPAGAYVAVALAATRPNGTTIATQAVAVTGTPVMGGTPVLVYVGGDSGGISGDALVFDGTSDLGTINLAIQTKVVPLGQTAQTLSAVDKSITIRYTVYVTKITTLSTEAIKEYIRQAVATFVSEFPMGGYPDPLGSGNNYMFVDSIESVIQRAISLQPGLTNPVYTATVEVSIDSGVIYTTDDILFVMGEKAVLTDPGIVGTVLPR